MPTYDYACQECGHIQEEFHGMSGPVEVILCEKCFSDKMKKSVSAAYAKFNFECETNKQRGIDNIKRQYKNR